MDSNWTLELLSTRGLDQSILLTVLVGLWTMLFFTETLGWVFIGVVVPGYLASVFVIAPPSAAAIVFEAMVSLVLARFLAITLARTGVWTQFFGRDRFFLIVLVSVWVRQLNQTMVLPTLEHLLRTQGYPNVTLSEDFSSIGLVLIPLTANMFWRLSFTRGLLQFCTIVGLTYALLRWVLLPYTNLTDASLVLLYEDSAIDFVSNAKSYIVLIASAYLASLANLRYGWDFGGILIAALLSLLWWTPVKLGLTLLESLLLYWATRALLSMPGVRRLNLEGARKMATVFTFAFSLKCAIGMVIGDSFPGLKVTDLFAFGYLMSSILTVRMMVVGSVRRVMMPVVLTSVMGFVLSSLVGLGLSSLSHDLFDESGRTPPTQHLSRRSFNSVQGVLGYAAARRNADRGWSPSARAQEMHRRERLWQGLHDALMAPHLTLPDKWMSLVTSTELRWTKLTAQDDPRPVSVLHPGEDDHGNPFDAPLVLIREGARGPSIVIQWPQLAAGLAETAWNECLRSDCATLVMFSQDAGQLEKNLSPALNDNDQTLLQALRSARPLWHVVLSRTLPAGHKHLHLDGSSDEAHAFLRQDLSYRWDTAPEREQLRAAKNDRVLRISTKDRLNALGAHWDLRIPELSQPSLRAYLEHIRTNEHESPAPHDVPDLGYSGTELRILQRHVVEPLIEVAQHLEPDPLRLASIQFWAQPLGFALHELHACGHTGCYVLTSLDSQQALVWALAKGANNHTDIEIPRAQRERGTLGLGLAVFSAFGLRSLVVHIGDWHFDPTHIGEVYTAFQAIHQGLDERSEPASPTLILRGFHEESRKETRDPSASVPDVLAGLGYPVIDAIPQNPELRAWTSSQGILGFLGTIQWSDASAEHHSFSGAQIPQVRYSRLLGKKQPIVLWLSSKVRGPYLRRSATYWGDLGQQLRRPSERDELTWSTPLPEIDEATFLQDASPAPIGECHADLSKRHASSWPEILAQAERFARHRHPQELFRLADRIRANPKGHLELARGANSGLPYLALTWVERNMERRALVMLGEAHEARRVVSQRGWGQLGPWPSLDYAQLYRTRTLMALSCAGGR